MQTVYLHIFEKTEIPALQAKQRDVGRKFKAVITDGSEEYQIPENAQLSVWYSGTSGEGHYSAIGANSAFVVEGDTVTVELIAQMLINKGGGTLCLSMNAADGTQIGLWDIPYFVEALPGADSAAAQQYYDAFSETVAGALDAAARAESAVESMTPDTTLTVSGRAADAAAVGTALALRAPAGYGLGCSVLYQMTTAKTAEELDTLPATGWYCYDGGAALATGSSLSGIIRMERGSENYITQWFTGLLGDRLVRAYVYGTGWTPWEWENPPMNVGVEYRTTARWQKKPVYTKLVDCSTLPDAGTEKAIAHNAQATKILQCAAQTSDGATLPMDRSNYGTVSVMATLTDIRMRTGAGANVNWLTATCRLWYTKD